MFIQTEDTPNPATMKFLPSRAVLPSGQPLSFARADGGKGAPLAAALFDIEGVEGVLLATDFLTVTRSEKVEWDVLRPLVLEVLMNHFLGALPIVDEACEEGQEEKTGDCAAPAPAPEDEAIVLQIKDLLDERVRPVLAQDGGDVAFVRYEAGIAYLRLRGACAGCPGATATLKMGVERLLRYYIPEVQEVRQVL